MSTQWMSDVTSFHRRFNQPVAAAPTWPGDDAMTFRDRIMREEWEETAQAIKDRDLAEVADGLIDLIYGALGTFVVLGIDPEPLWQAVHQANMAKQPDGTKKPVKPAGWTPPDIQKLIEAQTHRPTK